MSFGDRFFPEYKHLNLHMMPTSQLETLLDDMKLTVSCRSGSSTMHGMAQAGLGILEGGIGPRVGLHLEGLPQTCMTNESYVDCLTEISLENEDMVYVSPWKRLMMTTFMIASQVHNANVQRIEHAKAQYAAMQEALAKKAELQQATQHKDNESSTSSSMTSADILSVDDSDL